MMINIELTPDELAVLGTLIEAGARASDALAPDPARRLAYQQINAKLQAAVTAWQEAQQAEQEQQADG